MQEEKRRPKKKKALITGVTGMDGALLSDLLLTKGYQVHGIFRPTSNGSFLRIQHLISNKNFFLHEGDLADEACWISLLQKIQPDEIYNLGAQSHVHTSARIGSATFQVNALGVLHILEAIRLLGMQSKVRLYQAGTSEMLGGIPGTEPQSEETKFYPRSLYAVAKVAAHYATINYRESYKMFAVSCITYNHEHSTRAPTFVTRKTTLAVARIIHGEQKELLLGNLEAKRDWSSAQDIVEAMHLVLQANEPKDYIIASGETHTVREFVTRAFEIAGLPIEWSGSGVEEVGKVVGTERVVVRIDPELFRPAEVDVLQGDSTKIRKELGWSPKVSFDELIHLMVKADLELVRKNGSHE